MRQRKLGAINMSIFTCINITVLLFLVGNSKKIYMHEQLFVSRPKPSSIHVFQIQELLPSSLNFKFTRENVSPHSDLAGTINNQATP